MTRFERWAIWSTSVATFVTGVIYLWMKYLVVSDDPLAVVNHPWQPAMLNPRTPVPSALAATKPCRRKFRRENLRPIACQELDFDCIARPPNPTRRYLACDNRQRNRTPPKHWASGV